MTDRQLGISEFSSLVGELVGERLARVRYAELSYDGAGPQWKREDHHSLDFGLELGIESGELYSICWDKRGAEYGLAFWHGFLEQEILRGAFWDVTHESPWAEALRHPIRTARVYWTMVQQSGGPEFITSAACIGLRFRGGTETFIAYGEFSSSDQRCIGDDHVSVFFSESLARRYRIGPFDPARILANL